MGNSHVTSGTQVKVGKRRLSGLLIYPQFQLALLIANSITLFVTLLFVGVQSWRLLAYLRHLGVSVDLPPQHVYYKFIDMQEGHLWMYLALAFVLSAVISGAVSLYLSHRMAGPIVRLRGYFKDIEETGKVTRELKFREKDFFRDLPMVVNGALHSLKKEK